MPDIGSLFRRDNAADRGVVLTRAESGTAPIDQLPHRADFQEHVRRASQSGHPDLGGAVLDDRVEALRIRGTYSPTPTRMAFRGV